MGQFVSEPSSRLPPESDSKANADTNDHIPTKKSEKRNYIFLCHVWACIFRNQREVNIISAYYRLSSNKTRELSIWSGPHSKGMFNVRFKSQAGGPPQLVVFLSVNHKALSSDPSTTEIKVHCVLFSTSLYLSGFSIETEVIGYII
jgi:hypothetical protein